MDMIVAKHYADIEFCRDALLEFRPNLKSVDYLEQVMKMMTCEQFKLVYIPDDENKKAAAFIGYRRQFMLRTGNMIYIDDLFTNKNYRGRGYANALLEYVKQEAKSTGIAAIHLDSGYALHTAHRLYLNNGYILDCNHFSQQTIS